MLILTVFYFSAISLQTSGNKYNQTNSWCLMNMDCGCYINIRSVLGFVSRNVICMIMKYSFQKVGKAIIKVNVVV